MVTCVMSRIVAELAIPSPMKVEDNTDLRPGTKRYASFTWTDFWASAPWMREHITMCIDGPGLGLG